MNINFQKELKNHLKLLDVTKKSNIVVYANLSSFADYSKKLPVAVLDTLLKVIGSKGSMIMPTYSLDVPKNFIYDIRIIANLSNISMLSKIFFLKKKVNRSHSPIHYHIGIGPKSKFLLKTNEYGSFGQNSDFYYMKKLNFKLIMLGCGPFEGATYLHQLETLVGVPYRKWIKLKKKIKKKDKIKTIEVDYYSNVSKYKADFNKVFEFIKKRKGKIKKAGLKFGSSYSIDFKEMHKHCLPMLKKNKFFFVNRN